VARQFLGVLAAGTPLLRGAGVLAFIDMDSMQKRVYGHRKDGAGFGHTKIQGKSLLVRGLNALAAVISTPLAAPVIAATRLRGGTANSARGAASLAAEAITTARQAGCSGLLVFRIDSPYYSAAVLQAIRRGGARFSVTVPMDRKIRAAIASVSEDAWTPITYPRAIWDEDQDRLISDAEVAELPYTAFASRKGRAITARLIVRRVKDLNPQAARGRTSCSRSGGTMPCSLTPRSSWSRPRRSTAIMPSSSRSSPIAATGRLLTCHPGISRRTPRD
jgi:hypothetical protein